MVAHNRNVEEIITKENEWKKKPPSKSIEKEELKDKIKTHSGIELRSVFGPEDVKDIEYSEDLGMPGSAPFTRGVYPSMYRGRLWTMRQYSYYGQPLLYPPYLFIQLI